MSPPLSLPVSLSLRLSATSNRVFLARAIRRQMPRVYIVEAANGLLAVEAVRASMALPTSRGTSSSAYVAAATTLPFTAILMVRDNGEEGRGRGFILGFGFTETFRMTHDVSLLHTTSPPNYSPSSSILQDKEMPHMDGYDATDVIRGMGYKGAIIGLTGNAGVADSVDFMRHGVNAVVVKPVRVAELLDILEQHIGGE